MELFYSKIKPYKILHMVNHIQEAQWQTEQRKNLIPPDNFIQCSLLKMPAGKTFKPHRHIWKKNGDINVIAQESWVVITGSVQCTFFDLNDEILAQATLFPGDASFTIEGGHTYKILENNTVVYEYKTGPYGGQKQDKVFIK
jgi:cupin fold WbuC family metalloprotein